MLFFALTSAFGILLSWYSIIGERFADERYTKRSHIAWLLVSAVLENVGFRPWKALIAWSALFEFLRGDTQWGRWNGKDWMGRRCLQAPTPLAEVTDRHEVYGHEAESWTWRGRIRAVRYSMLRSRGAMPSVPGTGPRQRTRVRSDGLPFGAWALAAARSQRRPGEPATSASGQSLGWRSVLLRGPVDDRLAREDTQGRPSVDSRYPGFGVCGSSRFTATH